MASVIAERRVGKRATAYAAGKVITRVTISAPMVTTIEMIMARSKFTFSWASRNFLKFNESGKASGVVMIWALFLKAETITK